jgi:hypothetical protein
MEREGLGALGGDRSNLTIDTLKYPLEEVGVDFQPLDNSFVTSVHQTIERRPRLLPRQLLRRPIDPRIIDHVTRIEIESMRTKAAFRLFGDNAHTAYAVTQILDISPSRCHETGDTMGHGSTRRHDSSLWLLETGPIEDGIELSSQLQRLLEILNPVRDKLWRLVEVGYRANWICYVASSATEHAVELPRDLLMELHQLPGDLWLDIC